MTIWNKYANQDFCSYAALLFGLGTIIAANYGAPRLRNYLPPLVYAVFPVFSGIGILFMVTLLPQGAMVFDHAQDFIQVAKGRAERRYKKRVAASLTPIGIQCGSCGMVKGSWTFLILDIIANYTITMLLTF